MIVQRVKTLEKKESFISEYIYSDSLILIKYYICIINLKY